jgi:hypothetical protein
MQLSLRYTILGVLLLLVLIYPGSISYAQGIAGSTSFNRQLDAVQIRASAELNYVISGLRIQAANRNTARYFLFDERPQNIQKEHDALISLAYPLHDNLSLTSDLRSFTFTNTGLRQDIGLLGIAYVHPAIGTIHPSIGFMRDQRSDRLDDGFAWSLKTQFNSIDMGDTRIEPSIQAEVSYIDPRRFVTTRFGAKTYYNVDDLLEMRSDIWFGNTRRDSYQASSLLNRAESNFMESIDNDTTYAAVSLSFPVINTIRARVNITGLNNVRRLLNAPLDNATDVLLFDSRSLRQHLDITSSISYPSRIMRLNAGFTWSAQVRESRLINTDGIPPDQVRRRTEILENSNFTQSRFELFTSNDLQLTSSYRLGIDLSSSILRYDTPEINKDNRDEFAFLFRIRNNAKLSESLQASILLAGEAFHYVYLFAERSIENNWRRSIRLLPQLTWTPSSYFTMTNTFLVRANYTVDDFELPGRQKNDQSAREMAMFSAIDYQFAPNWTFRADASRSELRIGKLYWKTFQETPIDTLISYDLQGVLSRQFGNLTLSSGVRYFRKLDFLQTATVQIETEDNGARVRMTRLGTGQQITTQIGPIVTILLPFLSKNELYITGWYQIQRSRRKLYIDYPEAYRDAFRRAEKQTTRRTFPNLEMVARFGF